MNPFNNMAFSIPNIFNMRIYSGYWALMGGFVLHLTLGTLYCFGNIVTYMASYLRKYVNPETTYNDLVWIPVLATIGQVMLQNTIRKINKYL